MKIKKNIRKIIIGEQPLSSILYYIQGNLRYKIYYSKYSNFFLRKHILEQINYRIHIMNTECYDKGECIKCGCQTTHLQMSNKTCEGLEYPPIVSKRLWNNFKNKRHIIKQNGIIWMLTKDGSLLTIAEKHRDFDIFNRNNKSKTFKFKN